MAGLNEDAQWIVMMGFIVSFGFFFLAMLLNQSTVVGQTTAESVLDFPKNDIRDLRSIIIETSLLESSGTITQSQSTVLQYDITTITQSRKMALIEYTITNPTPPSDTHTHIFMHYNNGVTSYNETWLSP